MRLRRPIPGSHTFENEPTLAGRALKSDAREIQTFYHHYYKKYIQALQNASDQFDRAQLTKAYQTAAVLFEVLKAVTQQHAVEVDHEEGPFAANVDYLGDIDWDSYSKHGSTSDGRMDNPNKGKNKEEVNVEARHPAFLNDDWNCGWELPSDGELGSAIAEQPEAVKEGIAASSDSRGDFDSTLHGDGSKPSGENDSQNGGDNEISIQGLNVPVDDTKSLDPQIDAEEKSMNLAVEKKGIQKARTTHHYAWLYQRKPKKVEPAPMSIFDQIAHNLATYDPYGDKLLHEQYHRELKKKAPVHVCSACFFELNKTSAVKQMFHYMEWHKTWNIKCQLCSARFILQSAVDEHVKHCHEPSAG